VAFNQQDFTCATSLAAANRMRNGVSTWRYRYLGDWENLRLYPTSGAYHGVDLNMVFGTSVDDSGLPESEREMETQALMQRAWAAFAGDPSKGLKKVMGWPSYDADSKLCNLLPLTSELYRTLLTPCLFHLQRSH
jgi:cholinesterase